MPVFPSQMTIKRKVIIQNQKTSGSFQTSQYFYYLRAQCIKHKLLEYEPIIGPGKFDASNTQNAFTAQTPNSSYLFTIIQNQLIVAYKNKLLQYDYIPDLLSAEKYSSCRPKQQYTVTQGDVISLHSQQALLIVRTDKAIVFYKSNNQNVFKPFKFQFTFQKVYNYQGVKQSNIQDNRLFLCLSDKLVAINLTDQTETYLKQDNQIVAGFWNQKEFYYICQGSDTIKTASKQFQIKKPQEVSVKSIFIVGNYICVCGYETKYEPQDEEDEEPATYGAHIYWFDMKNNQPIKEAIHIEIDLIQETNDKGDFGILQLCDLQILYGSNLRKTTFWKLGTLVAEAKQFQNSDEKMAILQHSELRGLALHLLNPFIGLGMNERSFRCINRNPNILIMNKKGEISTYEFLDFNQLIEFQQQSNLTSSTRTQPQCLLLTQSQRLKPQQQQIQYPDIQYTVVESLQNEVIKLANPPFNLALQLSNNQSQLVMGEGPIDYEFRLNQAQIPSANLVTQFQHFQIFGHRREILIMTPLVIQNILLRQPHFLTKHEITKNFNELIQGVYTFQNQVFVHTEQAIYLANIVDNEWKSNKILSLQRIKRVQVNENYIIIQADNDGSKTFIYKFENSTLQLCAQHQSDAGCYFQYQDQVGLLLIQDGQLYFVKDFTTRSFVATDIQIDDSRQCDYYVAQLHNNHIYIAFGIYRDYDFKQYILNFDLANNSAKQENHLQQDFNDNNINDYLVGTLEQADWNITFVETNTAKLIIINPNSIQQGFIIQVCGDDLRLVENDKGEPATLPCYRNLVKGISVSNYLLPKEKDLCSKSGFCKAKKEKEFEYQMQPSILLFEYDEQNTIQVHRFLIIKSGDFNDKQSILKVYQEPIQQSQPFVQLPMQTEKGKISTTESQMSLQPPPSKAQSQNIIPPTKIAQITQQLVDFCQTSMKQLEGEDDQSYFKPFFNMFTQQRFLDELSSRYLQIQNQRKKMLQQTKENPAIKEFCLLRKSFQVQDYIFTYPKIEELLKEYAVVSQQFSWVCNFVLETLELNPYRRDRISFGQFNFPDISHIQLKKQNKQKKGRRIAFDGEETEIQPQPKPPQQTKLSYIQKLCCSQKSNVRYFKLKTEKNEVNDLNIQPMMTSTTSFGLTSQLLLKPPQVEQVADQYQNESVGQVSILQAKSEIISKQTTENKGLARTKGGYFDQNSQNSELPSQNPFSDQKSQTNSNISGGLFQNLSNPFGNPVPKNESVQPPQSLLFGAKEQANIQNPLVPPEQKSLFSTDQKTPGAPVQQPPKAPEQKPSQPVESSSLFGSRPPNQTTSIFGTQQKPPATEQKPVTEQKPATEQKPTEQKPVVPPQQTPGSLFSNQLIQSVEQRKPNESQTTNQQPLFGPSQPPPQQKPKTDSAAQLTSLIPGLSLGSTNQANANEENKKNESETVKVESKETKPPPTQSIFGQGNLFGSSSTGVQPGNLFGSTPAQPTNLFLGIPSDAQQTPKKKEDTQKSQPAPSDQQTAPPQQQPVTNQPKPDQPVPTSQPLISSLGQNTGQSIFGSQTQPLQFQNFNQTQGSSLFQQSNTQFTGMQNIGISQPISGGLNINPASFGASSSIFDQPAQQQTTTQQKISFTGLSQQGQNTQLPNSIGGLMGQTGTQPSFIQSTGFNLGFDPAAEKPRK